MTQPQVICADAARLPYPSQTVDLVMGSPPYCDCRTYGNASAHSRTLEPWVQWMIVVSWEALRVSRGAVVWVVAGPTRKRNYQPAPEALLADWHRAGGHSYRPAYFHRVGIPGSGGDQWLRADVETVLCLKRPGPLPWSCPTALGHPPRYRVGGLPSHRSRNGVRVNPGRDPATARRFSQPSWCNPGTLMSGSVGKGHMGSDLAHQNEAPYPQWLAERLVRILCPPGGKVLDPFSGSGTTAAAALAWDRVPLASDIRLSQCRLTCQRVAESQAGLTDL